MPLLTQVGSSFKVAVNKNSALEKSSVALAFTLLAVSKRASWRTCCGPASCPMVNTPMNSPQSKDRSGSTRSDCKITPRSTCPSCTPSNTTR
ncbi:hypothetical protein ATANTOWER_013607 [Ataeniobius toweri]|uniref:Uncharacterized protein n=1 Tax=Ataeniobius toweri TaxID=208326 RepID=A0ABU7AGD4_9TELE|nr:hypothetical protein [Ataeniobius toweri]